MNSVSAQFLFDFGSPNAYLSHKVIPAIEARTGVAFEYVPTLLGGLFKLSNNRSPMVAFADIPKKQAYDRLEMRRFISKHGLTQFQANPHFPVNTLQIMRGAVAAIELGCAAAYNDAMFSAMWEQGLNMNEPDQIRAVLLAAKLDAGAVLERTQDANVKARLLATTQQAYDDGAFGSPMFLVGQEIYFGKDRLRDVEDEIVRVSQA